MSLWRLRKRAIAAIGDEGEFLDYREEYRPHDCKVPGPLDGREDYRGPLASGTRWRCRRCGCEWHLSEYYFPYRKWYRRDDPGEEGFASLLQAQRNQRPTL